MRKQNPIFLRFFISYLLTIIIPVTLLIGFMFIDFTKSARNDFINQSSDMLSESMRIIESKFDDIRKMILALPGNKIISLYRWEEADYIFYDVVEQLKGYLSVNHYFTDIAVYIHGRDMICSAMGSGNIRNFVKTKYGSVKIEEFYNIINSCEHPTILNWTDDTENISIVYPYPYVGKAYGSVIVFLDRELVNTALLHSVESISEANAIIMDDKGNIFASLNNQYISVCNDIAKKVILNGIVHEYFNIDGVKFLVIYNKSDVTGYTYMSIIPANLINANIISGVTKLVFVCSFVCVIGSVIILYFMKNNYNPIHEIASKLSQETGKIAQNLNGLNDIFDDVIDKHHNLKQQAVRNHVVVKRQLFQKLLTGSLNDLADLGEFVGGVGLNDNGYIYGVVFIILDQELNKDLNGIDLFLKPFYQGVKIYQVDTMQPNRLCFILSFREDMEQQTDLILGMLRCCLEELLNIKFTIGTGIFRKDIMKLSQSYVEAMSALDWRFVNGGGGILRFDNLPNVNASFVSYTPLNVEVLSNSIISGDIDGVRNFVNQSVNEIRSNFMPLYMAKCVCYDMINTIVRTVKQLNINTDEINASYVNAIQIVESQTIDELSNYIIDVCEKICNFIAIYSEESNIKLRDSIEEYIMENYLESTFSLESMAEHFQLSYGYLSRFFKEQFGCKFSDYISIKRIDYAKKLLVETDASVESIVLQIGYFNVPAFNRKFKKVVGTTPGKWRRINEKEKSIGKKNANGNDC